MLRKRSKIAICLAVWLGWCAGSTLSSSAQTLLTNGEQNQAEQGTAEAPFIGAANWISVVSTAVIALVTIVLGTISYRQYRDTRILQRAYLSVEPGGLHCWRGSDAVLGHVGVRNTGHLPARDVSWILHIESDTDYTRRSFPISDEPRGNHVITPGSTMPRGTKPAIIAAGDDQYCYVWGKISYKDGFGVSRFTAFCHRYNCSIDSFVTHNRIDPKHARYHDYGNDAD